MASSNRTLDIVLHYEDHVGDKKTVVVEKGVQTNKVSERIDVIVRNGHLISTTGGGFYRVMTHRMLGIEAIPNT